VTTAGKSRLKEAAILALMTGAPIAECAARIEISERTLLRWMQEPWFAKRYSEKRAEALRAGTDVLLTANREAAGTLVTLSKDLKTPIGTRIQASVKIIELGRGGVVLEELEERLAALERNLKEDQRTRAAWKEESRSLNNGSAANASA
jgi:transposase-like protein